MLRSSRRRAVALGLGIVTVVGVALIGIPTAGAASPPSGAMPGPNPRFVTSCKFSHQLSDDPIVKPGMPGASHSHDFFGNTTTNAFSTLKTLKKGGTTCIDKFDLSGYWVPSLTVDGQSVLPSSASVYYSAAGKPLKSIHTIPRGLEVVAGSAMATAPQGLKITSWNCGADEDDVAVSVDVPTCSGPDLTLHVNFPDCWNGTTLDSPDHKSHLAYHGNNGVCPAGFPIAIPRLRINVHYPTVGGPGVALASGGQYSGHADFFNVWQPTELQRLIKVCIKTGVQCTAKQSAA
jgi:hypothetical protein